MNTAIELEIDEPLTYYWRGLLYVNEDDLERGAADLQKAIDLGLEPKVETHAKEVLAEIEPDG